MLGYLTAALLLKYDIQNLSQGIEVKRWWGWVSPVYFQGIEEIPHWGNYEKQGQFIIINIKT